MNFIGVLINSKNCAVHRPRRGIFRRKIAQFRLLPKAASQCRFAALNIRTHNFTLIQHAVYLGLFCPVKNELLQTCYKILRTRIFMPSSAHSCSHCAIFSAPSTSTTVNTVSLNNRFASFANSIIASNDLSPNAGWQSLM